MMRLMQKPPDDVQERSIALITSVLSGDPNVILTVVKDGDPEDFRWVAMSLAKLVAVYVTNEAEDQGRDPVVVWADAVAKMREAM